MGRHNGPISYDFVRFILVTFESLANVALGGIFRGGTKAVRLYEFLTGRFRQDYGSWKPTVMAYLALRYGSTTAMTPVGDKFLRKKIKASTCRSCSKELLPNPDFSIRSKLMILVRD